MHVDEQCLSKPTYPLQFTRELLEFLIRKLEKNRLHVKIPRLGAERKRFPGGHFHILPEVFLQISGITRFHCFDQDFTLYPKEICIMPREIAHAEWAEDYRGPFYRVVFGFKHESFSFHFCKRNKQSKPKVCTAEHYEDISTNRFVDYVEDIITAYWQQDHYHNTLQKGILMALFSKLLMVLTDTEPSKLSDHVKISHCKKLILSNLNRGELNVKSLADSLQCSADYLSWLFKQKTGENVISYIREKRFERAKELLKASHLNISEIAWVCGFNDPGYFARLFKKQFLLTPKQYRITYHREGE